MGTSKASSLINSIYNHPNATIVSKAKILEISDKRFGLPEIREPLSLSHLEMRAKQPWLSARVPCMLR
jgi:hypothetical protein